MTSANSPVSAPAGDWLGSLFQELTILETRDTGFLGPSLPSCPHVPGEMKQPGPKGTTRLHLAVSPKNAAYTALLADLCTPCPSTRPDQALFVEGQCQDGSPRRGRAKQWLSGPVPGPGLHPRCCSRIQKPPLFTAGRRQPERCGCPRSLTQLISVRSRPNRAPWNPRSEASGYQTTQRLRFPVRKQPLSRKNFPSSSSWDPRRHTA